MRIAVAVTLARALRPPRTLRHASRLRSAAKDAHTLSDYMLLPCGLIRGGLACLGYTCSVSCDISTVPSCSFTIRMKVS